MNLKRNPTNDGVRRRRLGQNLRERDQGRALGSLHLAPQGMPLSVEQKTDVETMHHAGNHSAAHGTSLGGAAVYSRSVRTLVRTKEHDS